MQSYIIFHILTAKQTLKKRLHHNKLKYYKEFQVHEFVKTKLREHSARMRQKMPSYLEVAIPGFLKYILSENMQRKTVPWNCSL